LFAYGSQKLEERVSALRYGLYRNEENANNLAFSVLLGVTNSISNHNHRVMVIAYHAV